MAIPFSVLSLLLTLLFSPLPSTQVEIECTTQDLAPTNQAEDCRFLLSHLPTSPILNSGHSPRWSISVPFLPKAYIRHRSCMIQFTVFVSRSPVNLESSDPSNPTPPVMEMWDLFREIGGELVTQCTESDLLGYGRSTYPWMNVVVLVGATPNMQETCWARQRDQRRLVALPMSPDEDYGNVFGYAIYDV